MIPLRANPRRSRRSTAESDDRPALPHEQDGPLRTGVWFLPAAPAPAVVDALAAAERAGIDDAWIGDEGPGRGPFALLAAAALRTERIRLGVAVTNPYLRHPTVSAAEMMTVNELSGGRAVLALGTGGRIVLGPPGGDRVAPLNTIRRTLRTLRAVAENQPADGYEPPEQAFTVPGMPIYVGARSERLNRLASGIADGAFFGGVPDALVGPAIGWARSQRRIDIALYTPVVPDEEALERLRPHLVRVLDDAPASTRDHLRIDDRDLARAIRRLDTGDPARARKVVRDDVLAELVMCGPPDVVGRALAEQVRRHRPTSVGLGYATAEPRDAVEQSTAAFDVLRKELG